MNEEKCGEHWNNEAGKGKEKKRISESGSEGEGKSERKSERVDKNKCD